MEIVAITGILASLAGIVLVILAPWKGQARLEAIYLFFTYRPHHPRPRHVLEPRDLRSPMRRWEDGPTVGIDHCPMCLQAPILQNGGPHCPRCGWSRPHGAPPWGAAQPWDPAEALNAKLDRNRASWAEPRPGLVAMPARTADISGGTTAAPEPPQAPRGPCPQTDGSTVLPGAWRVQLARALGALADAGQLAMGGPRAVVPDSAPPDPAPPPDPGPDDDTDDESWTRWGAMRWRPSAMATYQEQTRAWCAAQDAAALLISEAIAADAAAYLAGLRNQLAGGQA